MSDAEFDRIFATHGDEPAHMRDIGVLVRAIKVWLKENFSKRDERITALSRDLGTLEERVADLELPNLEGRVNALEGRPMVRDAGVWTSGVNYRAGDLVSHAGSGWICRTPHVATGDEPNHDYFRLFVKRGRDGRDAR